MQDTTYNLNGLTSSQAAQNLEKYGENKLASKEKIHPLKIFLSQFKDIMIIILLCSTLVSFLMKDVIEAITIIAIVIINAVIGFFQEYRTEKTLDALKKMSAPVCTVIRDGKKTTINTNLITVGDIVVIEAGNNVCADCILIKSNYIQADEAILTGESLCVDKIETTNLSLPNDLHCSSRLYMGTNITKGTGLAVVTDVGMSTQMGKIANMLNSVEDEPTPLQKRLDKMGKFIGFGCLIICFSVAIIGILRGEDILEMLVTGIALSVAAIPEGLPAIVTVALALAVGRMVKKNAIVRKLQLVETLGCATVICSDKTGTLTENKMTVQNLFSIDYDINVTGSGYEKLGSFYVGEDKISPHKYPDLIKLMEIGVVCNNSDIYDDNETNQNDSKNRNRNENTRSGSYSIFGDPMEAALLVMSAKASISKNELLSQYADTHEIPFDSQRKMMSVIALSINKNKEYVYTKGAVDVLIDKCDTILIGGDIVPLTGIIKTQLLNKCLEYANKGLRLLGFAYKVTAVSPNESTLSNGINKENALTFTGVAAFLDMPRKEAFDAVKKCRRAGIKPVMITGDYKETAKAIAAKLHIYNESDTILTGAEIDSLSDQQLNDAVSKTTVFARVSPFHKLRIVKAFKANGHTVAMTGDGVNDAPAVKEADIGVAMGQTGTDVTKEAAAMVLLDDNFSTLVAAVEEGRVIYNNIRCFIRYLLSCNIGEVLTMFLSLTFGMPLVLQPIHILLINLVTDSFPAIALGLEPPQKDIMSRKPRKANESIFSDGLMFKIIFRGCLIGLTTLLSFITVFGMTKDLPTAQTAAFYTLVLTQLIHSFECKSETKSLFKIPFLSNKKLILAVLFSFSVVMAVIYFNPLQVIFKTTSLSIGIILLITGFSFIAPIGSSLLFIKKPKLEKIEK